MQVGTDKDTYNGYTYEVYKDDDYPQFNYIIYDVFEDIYAMNIPTDIDSDEYYDTREDAHTAVCLHIDKLMDGPEE